MTPGGPAAPPPHVTQIGDVDLHKLTGTNNPTTVITAGYLSAVDERLGLSQHLGSLSFAMKQFASDVLLAELSISGVDGAIAIPGGVILTRPPVGTHVTYKVSADRRDYVITPTGADFGTVVEFDSRVGMVTVISDAQR